VTGWYLCLRAVVPPLLFWVGPRCFAQMEEGGRLACLNSVGWSFFVFRLVLCRQTLLFRYESNEIRALPLDEKKSNTKLG
jgi:hypothetical protein